MAEYQLLTVGTATVQVAAPTQGDVLVANHQGRWDRTTAGADGQVLTRVDGIAAWADAPGDVLGSGSAVVGALAVFAATDGKHIDPLAKLASPSGTAPGAGKVKFEVVPGTDSGTAKLIMYAGTSSTPVTIVDNVGSGF